jgi:glycosidase
LVRDFVGRHDYQTLIDTIAYLKRLGINAVQLMPITEFEGNESWGYNISFYFAPDKYYGTKDALKEFIDVCHREGMSVILDMVLNHSFGQSPMVRMYFNPNLGQYGQPTPDNPWFNQTDRHPFGVGYDFNHESLRTQEFVDTVLKYWLHEYKFDGFRFDLSKGFTQKNTGSDVGAWGAYDQSRINIWKRIMQEVRTYDTSAYMILEHFADNSEETVLSNEGFMFWGNINSAYNEATMGYFGSSDLNWANYKARGWSKPNLVAYAESHDEERLMYKNIRFGSSLNPEHNVKDTTIALRRIEAAMCFLIPLKGPKMIWQFGELGYDYSIDFNGRVGNKPIRWDYLNDSRRKRIYEVTSTLNRLKITDDSLSTDNYTFAAGNTAIKTLTINSGTTKAIIVGNFGVSTAVVTTRFPSNGMWYDVFGNDSVMLTDSTLTDTIAPGGYRVWLNRFVQTNYPTAIQEQSTQIDWSHATVYPNPTQSDFTIVTGIKGLPQLTMQITDITGKVVCSKYYNEAPEAIQMRSSEMGLTTGMYFVNLALPTSKKQFKLIIL